MKKSICGINCDKCEMKSDCGGCIQTKGKPFGGECVISSCCYDKRKKSCNQCSDAACDLKTRLIAEFNALKIKDMPKVTDLSALKGSFVNLEYTLPSGQKIKIFDDNKVYLGNQLAKKNCNNRCYGLTADENYLLVCEYGEDGIDPEIVIFKKIK